VSSERYPSPLELPNCSLCVEHKHVPNSARYQSGETRHVISLCLSAPHGVRKVRGDYWMLDSGKFTSHIDDSSWVLKVESSAGRWSRGASDSEHPRLLYAGISETRKRYLSQISNQTSNNGTSIVYGDQDAGRKCCAFRNRAGQQRLCGSHESSAGFALVGLATRVKQEVRPDE
jgi:hypothetical protein